MGKNGHQATIKDVAKRAEVSIATVSRVVHGLAVKEETRKRVELCMSALSYSPNVAARTLRTRSSKTVACVIRGMLTPSMAPFVRKIEEIMREAGYTLLLTQTDDIVVNQRGVLQLLAQRGLDGLFFTTAAEDHDALNEALAEVGAPVVLLDRDTTMAADAVTIAHRHGITAAVSHLATLGHRRIALLTLSESLRPGRERIAAFREAMQRFDLPLDDQLIHDQAGDPDDAFRTASILLARPDRPTAIIAGAMANLSGVLRATRALGMRIPKDLSVVAGSDSELAELASPGFTSIRWDVSQWGRIAAEMLLERINSPETPAGRQVAIPTELVVRSSCSPI